MLAPDDRRLLLKLLAPPDEGYALDQAIGTTYTLDLLALLRVPLAATVLPWSSETGGPVDNPFALLAALRTNASRISLFCHAGATKVPPTDMRLLTFLEDVVHPVTPPRTGAVFHPKIWLLRFASIDPLGPVSYRLLVLSRNLTFDRSWDVVVSLDGELRERERGYSVNRPLAEFVAALPGMARAAGHELSVDASARVAQLSDEVLRVEWTLPDDFWQLAFHPIGHRGRRAWPFPSFSRLFVVAPFVEGGLLRRLDTQTRDPLLLASRFEELIEVDQEALGLAAAVDVFDDPARLLDVNDGEDGLETDVPPAEDELSGLHAKLFLGEANRRAILFAGSANATEAAFDRNVEFLVELQGSATTHGIDAVRNALHESRLLLPFGAGAMAVVDEDTAALEKQLDRAAHALAAGSLRAFVEPDDGRWRTSLHLDDATSVAGLRVEARPVSQHLLRLLNPETDPCGTFPPTDLPSVTAFFVLRITGKSKRGEDGVLEFAARLPIEGAPDGRTQAVTSALLAGKEQLLNFLLLLLSSDEGAAGKALDDLVREPEAGSAQSGMAGSGGSGRSLPLLEPMLRAMYRDPVKLDDVGQLLRDLRESPDAQSAELPAALEDLWKTIDLVRAELR